MENAPSFWRSFQLKTYPKLSTVSAVMYVILIKLIAIQLCFERLDFFLFSTWKDILFQVQFSVILQNCRTRFFSIEFMFFIGQFISLVINLFDSRLDDLH